jgi:hypothetical protein
MIFLPYGWSTQNYRVVLFFVVFFYNMHFVCDLKEVKMVPCEWLAWFPWLVNPLSVSDKDEERTTPARKKSESRQ